MSIKNDNNSMNLLAHGTVPTPPPKPEPEREPEPEPDWEWEPDCDPPEPEAPDQDRKPGAEQPHGLTGRQSSTLPVARPCVPQHAVWWPCAASLAAENLSSAGRSKA